MWRNLARSLSVLAVSGLIPAAAWAEFVPGRLYLTYTPVEGCFDTRPDQIVEFDPLTAETRVIGEVPTDGCSTSNGLAFTPDGSGLRVATWATSTIHEFDAQGNRSVVLDFEDGIFGPFGTNSIAYGPDGSFYAVNWDTRLLRFPPDGSPAEVYGDASSGAGGDGAITLTPDNLLYFANEFTRDIRVFTGSHQSEVFDSLFPERPFSLASDVQGNLFAMTGSGIYRYDAGDPASRRLLTPLNLLAPYHALALSPDGAKAYAVDGVFVHEIDAQTGDSVFLGNVSWPAPPGGYFGPLGIAVYVPEPGTAITLLILAGLAARRR